jgi:hypothetical protein
MAANTHPEIDNMYNVPERLIRFRATIQATEPDRQLIPYRKETWKRQFSGDADLEYIFRKYPHQISRGDITELVREAQQQVDARLIRRVFLASMIWGYGTVGYGAWRTCAMLRNPRALHVLQTTFSLVTSGNFTEAYEGFSLRWCGPAFFTKYFYFVGLGCEVEPRPLILDAVVANSLERLLKRDLVRVDLSELVKVMGRDERGKITTVGCYAQGYQKYVTLFNQWADQLQCRPDSIELFLFNPPPEFWY